MSTHRSRQPESQQPRRRRRRRPDRGPTLRRAAILIAGAGVTLEQAYPGHHIGPITSLLALALNLIADDLTP